MFNTTKYNGNDRFVGKSTTLYLRVPSRRCISSEIKCMDKREDLKRIMNILSCFSHFQRNACYLLVSSFTRLYERVANFMVHCY